MCKPQNEDTLFGIYALLPITGVGDRVINIIGRDFYEVVWTGKMKSHHHASFNVTNQRIGLLAYPLPN